MSTRTLPLRQPSIRTIFLYFVVAGLAGFLSLFLGNRLGDAIGLRQINLPTERNGTNLGFLLLYHDVVKIEGSEPITGELSSWGAFSLVGNEHTYVAERVTIPAIAGNSVYVIKGQIPPGIYRINSPDNQGVSFQLSSPTTITTVSSRSDYFASYGRYLVVQWSMQGSAIGLVIAVVIIGVFAIVAMKLF